MNDRFLLDTNVVSEMRRSKPDGNVLAFMAGDPEALFLCDVTIAEIRTGMDLQEDAALRETIGRWLRQAVLEQFAGRLLPVTQDVLAVAFRLQHETRRRKQTLSTPDLLIAGLARLHGMIAVSRDVRPFRQARVPVLDPWKALFYGPDADGQAVDPTRRTIPEWRA